MKRIKHIFLGFVVAAIVLPAGYAMATPAQNAKNMGQDMGFAMSNQSEWSQTQRRGEQAEMLYAQAQRRISASQAKSSAMRRVRGAKFVNVQLVNQSTYRVRLQQKNGRIVDVYVDAYTGQVKG